MSKRAVAWVGGALAVIAAIAMGVYFAAVGLEEADKLASSIGAFFGLAGLVLAIYGTVNARPSGPPPPRPSEAGNTPGAVHNEISGGTHSGVYILGRDVTFSSPPPPVPPPNGPDASGVSR
ncbi:hypothetical protein [Nonomuraea sp. JJY05]|uniref:hypothetical protein n=1 Tax=Nonomuraea sp. JJY05 TaxID=3350255 RepID=UPI00373F93F6